MNRALLVSIRLRLQRVSGFSLVEVCIALGVLALFMTGLMVILGAISSSSRQVIGMDHAVNALSTLGERLQEKKFSTVYNWVKEETPLYLYAYRAAPSLATPEGDDSLSAPIAGGEATTAGLAYILRTVLRPEDDPHLDAELAAIEGRLYRVRLKVDPANPGGDTLPTGDYLRGYLVLSVNVTELTGPKISSPEAPISVVHFPAIINR